jgi:TonB family protein
MTQQMETRAAQSRTMHNPIPASPEIPHHASQPADRRTRLVAGLLTALIYVGFAALVWQPAFWAGQQSPPTVESFAIVLPDAPVKKNTQVPPTFLVHLIRPHAQIAAPPTFTIASAAPVARPLPPVTAATVSPLAGGSQSNNPATGASLSGAGTNGNAASSSACLDPEWLRKLHDHIRHYFYSPRFIHDLGGIGPVYLSYTVNRAGRILTLDIAKSSGSERLDDFAIERMRDANPLPSIPVRMHTDRLNGLVVLEFGPLSGGSTIGNC